MVEVEVGLARLDGGGDGGEGVVDGRVVGEGVGQVGVDGVVRDAAERRGEVGGQFGAGFGGAGLEDDEDGGGAGEGGAGGLRGCVVWFLLFVRSRGFWRFLLGFEIADVVSVADVLAQYEEGEDQACGNGDEELGLAAPLWSFQHHSW